MRGKIRQIKTLTKEEILEANKKARLKLNRPFAERIVEEVK